MIEYKLFIYMKLIIIIYRGETPNVNNVQWYIWFSIKSDQNRICIYDH